MNNSELTLDQLSAISAGVTQGPNGRGCTDRHVLGDNRMSEVLAKFKRGWVTHQPSKPATNSRKLVADSFLSENIDY